MSLVLSVCLMLSGSWVGEGTQDAFFDGRTLTCFQSCKVHTDAVITCPSPAASNITAGSKPAPVDFYLNGRLYTDDRPALDEEMYPEEALHISKFSLEYYADPQFFTAKKEKWIKHHPGEPLTLVIHVRECCLQLCFFRGVAVPHREAFQPNGGLVQCLSTAPVKVVDEGGRGRSCAEVWQLMLSLPRLPPVHQEMQLFEASQQRAALEGCNSKQLNKMLDM